MCIADLHRHPVLRCDQCARDDLVCMQARLDWNSDVGPIRMEGCLTCLSGCTNEGQDITNLYNHSISENEDVEKAMPDETDGLEPVGAPSKFPYCGMCRADLDSKLPLDQRVSPSYSRIHQSPTRLLNLRRSPAPQRSCPHAQ